MEFHGTPVNFAPTCRPKRAPRNLPSRGDPWRPVRTAFRRGDRYVGLRAGLTVSASIPISVLSISILALSAAPPSSKTTSSRHRLGGRISRRGVMFTIPALIFLGFGSEFTFWRIFPLALLGGWLGVLFMVPLRRQLIVKEHGNLAFPKAPPAPTCSSRENAVAPSRAAFSGDLVSAASTPSS